MNIITLDFETYYDKTYSLSKITTEEYVRHDMFEIIGVAVKNGDADTAWFSGNIKDTITWLSQFPWETSYALAHNAAFDGAILTWVCGIKPKRWLDTLSMARAVHGVEVGNSLKALAERYKIGEKGTEVVNALGKRRVEFTPAEMNKYAEYCINDTDLCFKLFHRLMEKFPLKELKVIDITIKMFTEPTLRLDLPLLEQHLEDVKNKKEKLLAAASVDKDTLMSSDKFAELLKLLGVDPPTKTSPRTGKIAWAFAKTDEAFKELQEHPDLRVQALVAARLGNKTTLEETRTQRLIDIAKRGLMPVPLKYYGAKTGRWSAEGSLNLQNLPSRGVNANKMKKAILAPEGYVIIDSDSSQIEARVLAWLAEQDDLVEAFAKGEDVYRIMAATIYNKKPEEVTDSQRFLGKTIILGCGYGLGALKFRSSLKQYGVDIDEYEANRIIKAYRDKFPKIPDLWSSGGNALDAIITNMAYNFGREGVLLFHPEEEGFILPSGLWQRYEGLVSEKDSSYRTQYSYKTRKGMVKIYGGKLVENIAQGIARCIIAEQMIEISKKYKCVLTVHDAIASIVRKEEVDEALVYIESCMRKAPAWAEGLPLNCESGVGESYGEC